MGRTSVITAVAFGLSLALGCSKDECETIYEAEAKCRGEKGNKEAFMKACAEAKSKAPDEFAAAAKCAKENSCDAMKTCGRAARGAKRAKEIAKAVGAGKWKDAWDDCTLSADYFADPSFKTECTKVFAEAPAKLQGEDLRTAGYRCQSAEDITKASPEFAKACQALNAGKLTAATAAATKARDTGVRDFKACLDLEEAAKAAGGDAPAKAKTLCEEANKAEDLKKALDTAKANAAAKKTDLPYQCNMLPDELDKIGTDWAKQKRDELLKACYVELGSVIVEVDSKDAKYVCPYRIKQLTEAATKYDLATKFPELAETLKKLPAKCKTK